MNEDWRFPRPGLPEQTFPLPQRQQSHRHLLPSTVSGVTGGTSCPSAAGGGGGVPALAVGSLATFHIQGHPSTFHGRVQDVQLALGTQEHASGQGTVSGADGAAGGRLVSLRPEAAAKGLVGRLRHLSIDGIYTVDVVDGTTRARVSLAIQSGKPGKLENAPATNCAAPAAGTGVGGSSGEAAVGASICSSSGGGSSSGGRRTPPRLSRCCQATPRSPTCRTPSTTYPTPRMGGSTATLLTLSPRSSSVSSTRRYVPVGSPRSPRASGASSSMESEGHAQAHAIDAVREVSPRLQRRSESSVPQRTLTRTRSQRGSLPNLPSSSDVGLGGHGGLSLESLSSGVLSKQPGAAARQLQRQREQSPLQRLGVGSAALAAAAAAAACKERRPSHSHGSGSSSGGYPASGNGCSGGSSGSSTGGASGGAGAGGRAQSPRGGSGATISRLPIGCPVRLTEAAAAARRPPSPPHTMAGVLDALAFASAGGNNAAIVGASNLGSGGPFGGLSVDSDVSAACSRAPGTGAGRVAHVAKDGTYTVDFFDGGRLKGLTGASLTVCTDKDLLTIFHLRPEPEWWHRLDPY